MVRFVPAKHRMPEPEAPQAIARVGRDPQARTNSQAQGYSSGEYPTTQSPGPGHRPPAYGPAYQSAQNHGPGTAAGAAPGYDSGPSYFSAAASPFTDGSAASLVGPDGPGVGFHQDSGAFWPTAQAPAGQVLTVAEDQAAAIRRKACEQAAAILQAAEQEAEAIRQAAEREAAELRAAVLAMSDELRRVATYATENLASPRGLATTPASAIAPEQTLTIEPPRPRTRPDAPGAKPDGSARPGIMPTKKPQQRPRQLQAMRIATCATAAMFAFAAGTGATELGLHGFKFFVFRQTGTGQTKGGDTDQQFLAQQAAAMHHVVAPKERHATKSHSTVKVHKK